MVVAELLMLVENAMEEFVVGRVPAQRVFQEGEGGAVGRREVRRP